MWDPEWRLLKMPANGPAEKATITRFWIVVRFALLTSYVPFLCGAIVDRYPDGLIEFVLMPIIWACLVPASMLFGGVSFGFQGALEQAIGVFLVALAFKVLLTLTNSSLVSRRNPRGNTSERC